MLRTQIGVVTQTIQLFHATVRDNLTFFDPAIPDEKLLAVLSILILENGEIREYGERMALATNPASRFYQLLHHGAEELLA